MAKNDDRKWLILLLLLALLFWWYFKGFTTGTTEKPMDFDKGNQGGMSFTFYTQDAQGNWKVVETPSWMQQQSPYAIVSSTVPPSCNLATECPGYTAGGNIDCISKQCVLARILAMDLTVRVDNTGTTEYTNCKVATPNTLPLSVYTILSAKGEKTLPASGTITFDTKQGANPGLVLGTLNWVGTTQTFLVNVSCINPIISKQESQLSNTFSLNFIPEPSGNFVVTLLNPTPILGTCGNTQLDTGELCDNTATPKFSTTKDTCTEVDAKYASGTLGCAADCTFDISGCIIGGSYVNFRTNSLTYSTMDYIAYSSICAATPDLTKYYTNQVSSNTIASCSSKMPGVSTGTTLVLNNLIGGWRTGGENPSLWSDGTKLYICDGDTTGYSGYRTYGVSSSGTLSVLRTSVVGFETREMKC